MNHLFGDDEIAEAAEPVDEDGTEELTSEEAVAFDEPPDATNEGVAEDAHEAEAAEVFDEEVEAAESAEGDELADFDADEKPATFEDQDRQENER